MTLPSSAVSLPWGSVGMHLKEDLDFADSEESADFVDTADTTGSHRGCTHIEALVMHCSVGCMEDKRSRPCLDPCMVDECLKFENRYIAHRVCRLRQSRSPHLD